MSKFLDKLNQIEKQLKEEENGQQATRAVSKDSRNNDRSSNGSSIVKNGTGPDSDNDGRSGDILRGRFSKLNKVQGKEKKLMITIEAGLKDLDTIEAADGVTADGKAVVRALRVLLKFLSTMRSNQLLTDADRVNIQKAKANRKPEEKKA